MTIEQEIAELKQRVKVLETIVVSFSKGLLDQRAAIIMQLGAVEDALGRRRSIVSKTERETN